VKALRNVAIFVILLALPVVGRSIYFNRGVYSPPQIVRPDMSGIDVPTPELVHFVDSFQKSNSVILFDFAHNNNLKEAELNEVWERLTARGSHPELVTAGEPLQNKLRRAQSYVVVSPRMPFTPEETRQTKHFVETGGRLLLATDPTRFEVTYDPLGFPKDRKSDVTNTNVLAALFGMVFEDDYVYNMTANAGSYRDVILNQFGDGPLTQGLKKVIFFAAHSISSSARPIVIADKDTRSSLSEKQGGLVVAAQAASDHVLGLGDFTFLTSPYNSVADNDRLVSNIADFLASAQRTYELTDFPYFFSDQVDLMYAGKKAIGGDVLSQAGLLQRAFDVAGKKLIPRKADSVTADALFIGLFDGTEYVRGDLATRQISITLSPVDTPTATPAPGTSATGAPTATSEAATPVAVSPTPSVTSTAAAATSTPQAPAETPIRGLISVADLGEFPTESVTLLSLAYQNGHPVMIVLGATKEGLAQTLALLSRGDLSQCLASSTAALCPAMPTFVAPAADVYVPPAPGEVPITTTSDFIQPVEPPVTFEPPAPAGTRAP
jgi:hypothetical protein